MHNDYDPAKTPGDTTFHKCMSEHCAICGPAGNTTLIDHNEKGILESALHPLTAARQAALGSDHDSHKQGIYTTNSAGDND
jgi:hypothetical protein